MPQPKFGRYTTATLRANHTAESKLDPTFTHPIHERLRPVKGSQPQGIEQRPPPRRVRTAPGIRFLSFKALPLSFLQGSSSSSLSPHSVPVVLVHAPAADSFRSIYPFVRHPRSRRQLHATPHIISSGASGPLTMRSDASRVRRESSDHRVLGLARSRTSSTLLGLSLA